MSSPALISLNHCHVALVGRMERAISALQSGAGDRGAHTALWGCGQHGAGGHPLHQPLHGTGVQWDGLWTGSPSPAPPPHHHHPLGATPAPPSPLPVGKCRCVLPLPQHWGLENLYKDLIVERQNGISFPFTFQGSPNPAPLVRKHTGKGFLFCLIRFKGIFVWG